jgi:hypothetical protein
LYAVDKDIPVNVRAIHPTGGTYNTNYLPSFNVIANLNEDLGLVIQTAVHTPSMIDNRCITSHGQQTGENDYSVCRRIHVQIVGTSTKIDSGVEVNKAGTIIRTAVTVA